LTLKGKEKQEGKKNQTLEQVPVGVSEGKKNQTLEQVPVGVSGKDLYCGRNVYILFPVLP
jgi:hypothetical protein